MIHEFAVDPALLPKWRGRSSFDYWRSAFGLGQPRVVSAHPTAKAWRKLVRKALSDAAPTLEGLDQARVEGLVKLLTEEQPLVDRADQNRIIELGGWLESALAAHRPQPFQGVLTHREDRAEAAILQATDHPPEGPAWQLPSTGPVARNAADLVARLSPMLRAARQLVIVDPYIDYHNRRFSQPLLALMDAHAVGGSDGVRIVHGEISNREKPLTAEVHEARFQRPANQWVPSFRDELPAGLGVQVAVVEQQSGGERLHERFVLTELGGVGIPGGIDNGDPGETTPTNLLSEADWAHQWRCYGDPLAFRVLRRWTR